ncbi:DUF1127 domain-containing protein [Pararoseomonas sp. SCSIO 73927]|uniref:DUF1127 domain-containing protein n=1 Tax=Pararoseomonas sp. SCSIO 73927 TaxID=3114537 RepID=UPI0030D030CA
MSDHALHPGSLLRGGTSARRVPAAGWLAFVARMVRAIEERRILATLDDRMLADVGLNRLDAEREAARAPWDIQPRV